MAVSDWSTIPANNVTIDGINIAENCPAQNLNNAIRAMMSSIKVRFDTGGDLSAYVLRSGGSFTTNPTYSGRGGYLHFNNSALTSGRIYVQPVGTAVPALSNGDILIEY